MRVTKSNLNKAVIAKIITQTQADKLVAFINQLPNQGPSFNLTNVLYYFGALIAIGAMTLLMGLGWESFGGGGILFLALCYALLGIALTHKLHQQGHTIPAGLCATFVICMAPLAIYGFQSMMDWWPSSHSYYRDYYRYIQWNWIFMELGTLAVGVVLTWIYRYPFMIMPIGFTLWFLSMDITKMILGNTYDTHLSYLISLYFGLIITLIGLWVDIRAKNSADYAFWLYLFGILSLWGGLTGLYFDHTLFKPFYLVINLVLMLAGVILNRKVFVIFGALGVFTYLSYLAFTVFEFSYLFPVVLTAIGFAIIYVGILWQRHEARITDKMRLLLPQPLRELLEARE